MRTRCSCFSIALLLVAAGAGFAAGDAPPPGRNIAAGCSYTFNKPPNYSYSTDEGDAEQLTDGVYTEGHFWTQKTTVGWSNTSPVEITVDLGRDVPIGGCSYSTAAGVAGVGWPSSILLLASDDGQDWYLAGDLIVRAAKFGVPPPDGYRTHRFVADDLATHGRYLRLVISPSGAYTFCDEIEVYQGAPHLMKTDRGKPIGDTKQFYLQRRLVSGVRTRLVADLATVRAAIEAAKLSTDQRGKLNAAVTELEAQVRAEPKPFPTDYRAVHPLTPVHARIFATMARVRRAQGLPEFFAWRKCKWDMLGPMEVPSKAPKPPVLRVDMMDGEYRAEAFNLTNLTDRDVTARVRIAGLPGGDDPDYVTVHQVEVIESQLHIPVADALPVAAHDESGWRIGIPAGMTRQVWLTFRPIGSRPGTFTGAVIVKPSGGLRQMRLPLTLRIYPLHFPDQPTCSLGVWDYTDFPYAYDITATNVLDAIENMRDHFVDTPWAHSSAAPWPPQGGFDDEGNLVSELDFDRFDAWIASWPGSRNYAIFLAVGGSLGGVPVDAPIFGKAVASWLKPWLEHMAELDVSPGQFYLLLVDEPHSKDQDRRILAWATAIKAAAPELNIWEDPTHHEPQETALREMFEACDVLCPNLAIFASASQPARDLYGGFLENGKTLWFYQCSGPSQTHDPYYYHRLQHWYAWLYGATGSGFWAYGDAGTQGTSWNPLIAERTIYTPVYLDENSVTDGKHWEAVREGIEDYEYLRMLRDRVAELEEEGARGKLLARARKLLESLPAQVCGAYDPAKIPWTVEKDRTAADEARVRILEALTALENL